MQFTFSEGFTLEMKSIVERVILQQDCHHLPHHNTLEKQCWLSH